MKYIYNRSDMKERRRELRKNSSGEEVIIWNWVRGKKLGKKFKRQVGIGGYIVDFYCAELKLVIEVDGIQHDQNKQYDSQRDAFLSSLGCKVIRFSNRDVRGNLTKVVETIQLCIHSLSERTIGF